MIYLASPYSHPDKLIQEQRFLATLHALAYLFNQGKHVYSPIAHTHQLAQYHNLPGDAAFWLEFNRDMLRRCDELLILRIDGWEQSKGVKLELQMAEEMGKPFSYL